MLKHLLDPLRLEVLCDLALHAAGEVTEEASHDSEVRLVSLKECSTVKELKDFWDEG